ncbi:MAG: ADOP family duplicated permease, partial [Gemmatimonadales bacterium]
MRRFFQPPVEREVQEELAFHLEMRTRELIAKGLDPAAARAEAERRLGDLGELRRGLESSGRGRDRADRRRTWLAELAQDLAYGWRTLRRSPGFTGVAVLTLGLGLAATTAIFGTLNAVVLRPLPIPEPERVMLASTWRDGQDGSVSVGNYTEWEARNDAEGFFSAMGAIAWRSMSLVEGDEPERVLAARVSAGYFDVFRLPAALGRTFGTAEDAPGAPAVVVLSDRLWRRRFGGDSTVVGRDLRISGVSHRVIGVMPRRFDFTVDGEELWVPIAFTPEQRAQHDEHFLTVYARLAPDRTADQAQARLVDLMRDIAARFPQSNLGNTMRLQPLMRVFVGPARERVLILFGAVGLVLLIACANVANLLLARGAGRSRELAVRAAIGAGRGRLVRQLLAEGLVLAVLAAVVGTALAWAGVRALVAWAPPGTPRLEQAAIDGPTLGFALLAAAGSTLLFALLPALRSARSDLHSVLRAGQARIGFGRDRLRQALVGVEVAFVLVLLVGCALLVRTAIHLGRVDMGFDPRGVLTARLALPPTRYDTPERARTAFEQVLQSIQSSPGVAQASLVTQVPMGGGGGDNGLIPEGKPLDPSSAVGARFRLVPPGYFATLGVAVRRGRDFGPEDRAGAPRAMIVNETLARALFPDQDPIGRRVACCEGGPEDPRWKTIVGVVADVRTFGPQQDVQTEFFLPIAQAPDDAWNWINRTLTLVVKARGGD